VFLTEFVATEREPERLAQEESDGRVLTPGSREWSIYHELVETRKQQDGYKVQRQLLENKLKMAIGRADGLDGLVTWKTEPRAAFDQATFAREQPDIFRSYVKMARPRVFRLSHGGAVWLR
jgi:hypothetical protein